MEVDDGQENLPSAPSQVALPKQKLNTTPSFGNPIPMYIPVLSMMPSNYSYHLSIFTSRIDANDVDIVEDVVRV
jgi:hypothetical protein